MAIRVLEFTGCIALGFALHWLLTNTIKKENSHTEQVDVHGHCKKKIQAERAGRINAEKALRAGVVEKISDPSIGYPLLVIGKVESPYLARRGTPRQGLLVPDSRSIIKLSAEIPSETLHGLEGYSHMFVHFLFHENTNLVKTLLQPGSLNGSDNSNDANVNSPALSSRTYASKSSTFTKRVHSFASKVLPPLLQGGSIGVFASRSPHRPNAIGLSLVKIISVDPVNRTVVISGADLVHGTPIVDLKPWGPFDCPTCIHNTVDHDGIVPCHGSLGRCSAFTARVPDWVEYGLNHPYVLPIEWNHQAKENLIDHVKAGESLFYSSKESNEIIEAIEEMLSLDIRSVHQGRGKAPETTQIVATELVGDRLRGSNISQGQNYEVEYDNLHIEFVVHNGGHAIHINKPWILIESIKKLK